MKRILGCVVLGLVTMVASAQWTNPSDDVPAYNATAPRKHLPPVLSGSQLTGPYFTHPYQVTVYKMAAKIPAVLHQEPCYCHCDRVMGHNSLHSCFEGTHGAACSTCMREAVYAYQQTKKGETPAQIRAGIERGDWQTIDLLKASLEPASTPAS
ncbi:MAG TPA: CYCXC family (seleno)protein [Edaphobacter sp.]|nr:CYCXC family (seleno)protein [Edaphobacter sp.]